MWRTWSPRCCRWTPYLRRKRRGSQTQFASVTALVERHLRVVEAVLVIATWKGVASSHITDYWSCRLSPFLNPPPLQF